MLSQEHQMKSLNLKSKQAILEQILSKKIETKSQQIYMWNISRRLRNTSGQNQDQDWKMKLKKS